MSGRRVTVFLLLASFFSGFGQSGAFPRALAAGGSENPVNVGAVKNREPLPPNAFYLLPLTSVKPRGWLRRQLQIQADGLSGHLDEFWPDLGSNSGWLGGTGEDWERGPYFLDGLVPLAYLLEDQKLIAKANKWVNWTLENQRPDGSIGPAKNQEWWPRMTMLKVLAQYQEATGDPRVVPLMARYLDYHAKHAAERPLREWAKFRWGEEVLDILWLYNRTGDRRLFDLARTLHGQGHDWKAQFENFRYTTKTSKQMLGLKPDMSNTTEESLMAHGVNNGMALKYTTLWSLITGDASDRKSIYRQLEVLDKYHLLPNGLHSGDEHYAGLNPSQGVETCTVVETMFSLAHVVAILGDPALGDRLEKITFNGLPGAFTGDMWAHQYDQQPNQVQCNIRPRDWTSNGPESNVFGLEPNFGCCTANMHQGWPKFAANLWMATPDDGLAAVAYAPSEVSTVVGRGAVRVRVAEETDYPFRGRVTFLVDPAAPVEFPFQLRIPAWARGATITVNGTSIEGVRPGTFHTLARRWQKGDRVELTLPLTVRTSQWFNDSVAVERGPLVFSLKIGEDWRKIKSGMNRPAIPPAADWEVHPTTNWNYGLIIDKADPSASAQVIEKPIGDFPFTAAGAPVELRIKGRRVPRWTMEEGSAGPPPVSPVTGDGPVETLTLIPYGSAKLRITAFPRLVK
jgi:DUF1680 family protein